VNISSQNIFILFLVIELLVQCQSGNNQQGIEVTMAKNTPEEAQKEWPEMGQQITFIGLKDCPTKFQI
jgi:hypothetical protein